MNGLQLALTNLTSPPVLAFALGLLATALRSDLKLPDAVYQALSIYLLLGIGIKGGVALSESSFEQIIGPLVGTLFLGIVIPVAAFYLLGLTKLDRANRGALAAHYGSTSLVTFTAGIVFLESLSLQVEGYVNTLLAVLEIPGIIIGLALAARGINREMSWGESLREILTGKSIFLLVGGVALGFLTGSAGYARIDEFFTGLFTGVLTLFLLELGMVAGRRIKDLRQAGVGLFVFGTSFPIIAGSLGVLVGQLTGMSLAGSAALGILAGSASYIAAPAAVRLALPEASPGIYLSASLGITFPFNLTIGIPVMLAVSQFFEGVGL
ncbi:MAG: hypothetical protein RIR89_199 [Actinomycetota bacterium]